MLALAAWIVTASCGGSPMAPSTNPPPQAAFSLASGRYLLTVSMSTLGKSGPGTCVNVDGAHSFVAVFVPTPVQVVHTGDNVTITPDDPSATFRMQLQASGASLSGTAAGQYGSGASTLAVTGASADGKAFAAGVVDSAGPYTVSGSITGTLTVGSTSCTNDGHGWTLMPRS
jgi:hypothetical protein